MEILGRYFPAEHFTSILTQLNEPLLSTRSQPLLHLHAACAELCHFCQFHDVQAGHCVQSLTVFHQEVHLYVPFGHSFFAVHHPQ